MHGLKYHIVVLLAAASLVQSIVSCNKPEENGEVLSTGSAAVTTAAVTEPPVFKEKDLGGDDLTFMTYNEHAIEYADNYIWADSSKGGLIEKAIANRNSETESKFNINIAVDEVYSPKNEATSRIQAGQCDFDVILEWGTRTASLALAGLLYDFNELDNVDLDRSYWIPGVKDDLNVGGKTYIATNYITMNAIDYAGMLYFNKTMYDKLGGTDSLYDLALNGTWTFDKYVDLAVSAVDDVNGDGIMSASDRYGIWGTLNECLTSLARSAGIKNTVKNTDGSYSLNVYCEKVVSMYTKFEEKLDNSDAFIAYEQIWQEDPNLTEFESRNVGARFLGFGEGHVLFMPGSLSIAHEFASMEDDYGILPMPLYDAGQTEYYHFIDANAPMFSIPAEGENLDLTGLILEYMAYKSEQYLLPAYVEDTVESKKAPDVRDSKMLDIIKNSLNYEWTQLYELEVTDSIMSRMMRSGSFKSVYNRYQSKAKAEINGCVNTLTFIGLE